MKLFCIDRYAPPVKKSGVVSSFDLLEDSASCVRVISAKTQKEKKSNYINVSQTDSIKLDSHCINNGLSHVIINNKYSARGTSKKSDCVINKSTHKNISDNHSAVVKSSKPVKLRRNRMSSGALTEGKYADQVSNTTIL